MRRAAGSEGIYFVVRLPHCWELVPFRFDEHSDEGHPKFWEEHITPELVAVWAPQLFAGFDGAERRRRERRLKLDLELHYDGFPRGRVTWVEETGRFVIYHGGNLTRAMKLTRRAIERAFGITGRANWQFDDHEQCTVFSAEGIQAGLHLRERWATVDPESA